MLQRASELGNFIRRCVTRGSPRGARAPRSKAALHLKSGSASSKNLRPAFTQLNLVKSIGLPVSLVQRITYCRKCIHLRLLNIVVKPIGLAGSC